MNKEKIILQQDNHEKLKISLEEEVLIYHIKVYFKWRKNVNLKRLYNEVNSLDYDNFIKYLFEELEE